MTSWGQSGLRPVEPVWVIPRRARQEPPGPMNQWARPVHQPRPQTTPGGGPRQGPFRVRQLLLVETFPGQEIIFRETASPGLFHIRDVSHQPGLQSIVVKARKAGLITEHASILVDEIEQTADGRFAVFHTNDRQRATRPER